MGLRSRFILGALGLAALIVAAPPPALAAPYCPPGEEPGFEGGFALLQSLLGEKMGAPLECQQAGDRPGDTIQQTTTGLAFYRRSTNTPTFTDGHNYWSWTPGGLARWTWPRGPLTPDSIFMHPHPPFTNLDPARLHTLVVTGDVGLVRMVNVTTTTSGDFVWPFRNVVDLLRGADITLINLEGPLIPGCPLRRTEMEFCGDPRNIEGLEYAGVDVAALANNHMLDHGPQGLDSTRRLLSAAGIAHAGYGLAATVLVGPMNFGFLAFDSVTRPPDVAAMSAEIAALRERADVVVVMFHWGAEYVRVPQPGPGYAGSPRDLARAAIDSGATLVVGNHPHWFQGVEIYKGRLVAYSHGNFVFDQRWSEETQQSVLGRYTFYDGELIDAEFMPIRIEDWGQPRPATDPERSELLRIMRAASEALTPY